MNSLFSLKQMRDKFYALSSREQLLVVGVVGVAIYFVFESLLFTPQSNRNIELMAAREIADTQVSAMRTELKSVSQSSVDLEKAQLENAQLKRQMVVLKAVLDGMQVSTPPIGDLVKGVLKDYPRVTLVSLKTLPVTTLIAGPQVNQVNQTNQVNPGARASPGANEKTIFKHGVDVEIQGNYLDLLAYLKNLEASSKNVFWSDVKLLSQKYPDASLRLTIFILSDQPILKIS